ncbi:MAG: Hpt domain-containing protein [Acidobacteriia bacterium]|nr:Hpt domain-containing protein [Terriglobia bacterium]
MQLDSLRGSIERGELEGIERAAHSFKVSRGTLSVRRASETALKLENTARNGGISPLWKGSLGVSMRPLRNRG